MNLILLVIIICICICILLSYKYIESFTSNDYEVINDTFPNNEFKIVDRITGYVITNIDNKLYLREEQKDNKDQLFRGDKDNHIISKDSNKVISLESKSKIDGLPLKLVPKKKDDEDKEKLKKWKINKFGHIYNLFNDSFNIFCWICYMYITSYA